jgi:peptidoglycan/LPS O-acetylase OafA/YrhL
MDQNTPSPLSHDGIPAGLVTRVVSSTPVIFHRLQYLRAIAALSVVLCHASYYLMDARQETSFWEIFGRAGAFGVLLFFAISGFLMAQLAPGATSLRFMAHRLVRIYPPLWIALFAVTVLSAGRITPAPSAMLLVPQGTAPYVLGVEWTLPFELSFYLIVCAVIAVRGQRWLPWLGLAWILLILGGVMLRPEWQQGQFPLLLNLPFSTYCLPFAGGLIIPTALRRGWVGPATPLLGLCALLANEAMPNAILGFGLLSLGCVLLVAAALRPRPVAATPQPSLSLVALGDWSYALYLIHVPVIRAMNALLPTSTPPTAQWLATVAAPVAVAVAFGKLDLWLYRVLKRRVDSAGKWVLAGITVVFLAAMLLVGGGAHWRALEANRASERLAPAAARLVGALDAGAPDIASAAERIGLAKDPALVGHFDNIALRPPVAQFLQGWAGDASLSARSVEVLIFQCGAYLGAAPAAEARPDVATVLRVTRRDFGFSATLPRRDCAGDDIFGVIIAQDQRFGLISAARPRQ